MDYSHRMCMDVGINISYLKKFVAPYRGKKILLLEVRTNFVLKEGSATVVLGSERYHVPHFIELTSGGWSIPIVGNQLGFRLMDYGMSDDAIGSLSEEIVHFAHGLEVVSPIVPIALEVEVCTVKQEGESSNECRDRAIQESMLVPLHLCSYALAMDELCDPPPCTYQRKFLYEMNTVKFRLTLDDKYKGSVRCPWCRKDTKLADHLSNVPTCFHGGYRFRVEDPEPCHLCSKEIKLGHQISAVPTCTHVFHAACILKWMDTHSLVCPKCYSPAYHPPGHGSRTFYR